MDVRLNLKSTVNVIGSVSDFTYKWSLNAGLSEADAVRLALALDELVTDIVLFAYRDEPGDFDISFRRNLSTVEIVIHEQGEPFSLDRHPYNQEAALNKGDFDGAGFELVRHLVDDFTYLNRGRAGKEFRLVKSITSAHIADIVLTSDLTAYADTAPKTDYVINLMTPRDAEDASRLIYRTYGHTYPKDDLYFPKKIEMALEQGDKYGVIVRTTEGEAVGYFAVLFSTNSKIGEVGEAVVSARHRRRGIMTMMLNTLIEEAQRRGLYGLYGEAITTHSISQRVNANYDMKSTALMLSTFPRVHYKELVETYDQAISVVLDFLPLVREASPGRYLPQEYADLLMRLYDQLGIAIRALEPQQKPLPPHAETEVEINYIYRHAVITVEQHGKDLVESVQATIQSLKHDNIRTVYLDLPLDDPLTPQFVPVLKTCGFIFCGLMPLFHHERDYLRLQRLFEPLNLDHVVLFSDLAKDLRTQIEKEIPWTSQKEALS